MADIADLRLKFSSTGEGAVKRDLRDIDGQIKTVERDAHSAGGALRGMFSTAGAFALGGGILGAIGAVKGALGGIINADAAMEQSTVILTQVTGSAERAKALIADVQKLAAATPFSFGELITATQDLEAFGLKSQQWLTIIGDTAAGTGKSVNQVTQAVLDAHTGQYERLKELGIDAQIEGDKLVFQYSKNGETIRKEVDRTNTAVIDSTLQGIWNDKYQGMMEKQSHTFVGQWSTLKDNVSMLAQRMSGGVFTALRGLLSFGNDVFAVGWKQAIENAFGDSSFGNALENIGTFVGDIVAAFGEGSPVSEIVKNLPESWQGAAKPILDFFDSLGDVWSRFKSGGFLAGVAQLLPELATMGRSARQFGIVAASALADAIANLGDFAAPIASAIGDKLAKIDWTTVVTADSFGAGSNLGTAVHDAIVAGVSRGFDLIVNADISAADVLNVAKAIGAGFVGINVAIASFIAGEMKGLVFGDADLSAIGSNIWEQIKGAILGGTAQYDVASGTFGSPSGGIGDALTGIGQSIVDGLQQFSVNLGDWLLQNGAAIVQPLIDFFATMFDAVTQPDLPDWLDSPDWITDPINAIATGIDAGTKAIKTAWNAFKAVMDVVSGGSNSGRTGDGSTIGGTGTTGGANSGGSGAGGELVQFLGGGFKAPKPDFSAFTGGLSDLAKTSQDQTNAITDQFVQLRNNAQTLAESTNNAVTNQFVAMRNNVQSLMGSLVATVSGALGGLVGTAAGQGYAVGAALGQGIYAGMAGWLGTIAAGAAALVSAAIAAARLAADARSPSRKMMALGNDMVAGLLIPLHGGRGQVAHAMGNLVALPAASTAARASLRGGTGGAVVQHVYQEGAFRGALISADFERRMERVASDAADRRINSRRLGESR